MYLAISPQRPGLLDSFLGTRADATPPAPQLGFIPSSTESVSATALVYNPLGPAVEDYNISYIRSLVLTTLSADDPLRIRPTSTTSLDFELSIETWSYTQTAPLVLAGAPASPWEIPWSADDYYTRSTTLYAYQGVVVPEISSKIFDGSWELVVLSTGVVIPAVDSLPVIRGKARAAIESTERRPSHIVGLNGLAQQQQQPIAGTGRSTYNRVLSQTLESLYNSTGIPPRPTTRSGVLKTLVVLDTDLELPTSDAVGAAGENRVSTARATAFSERSRGRFVTEPQATKARFVFDGVTTLGRYLGEPAESSALLAEHDALQELLVADNIVSPFASSKTLFGEIADELLASDTQTSRLPKGLQASLAVLVGGTENAYFQNWVYFIRSVDSPEPTQNITRGR